MSINKGVNEAHCHDPMLEASQEHLSNQVMEKMASPWKRRCRSPNRGKHFVPERTLVVMRESRVHPDLRSPQRDRSSKILPIQFVAERGCGSLLFVVLWDIIKFAIAVQVTYNIERFRGATSHGGSKKFLFPDGAERKDKSKVILSSCLDLLKALAARVRRRGSSMAVREADRVDANQVRTKTTHGTNAYQAGGDGSVWHCSGTL